MSGVFLEERDLSVNLEPADLVRLTGQHVCSDFMLLVLGLQKPYLDFKLRPPCYGTDRVTAELCVLPLVYCICTEMMQAIKRKDLF